MARRSHKKSRQGCHECKRRHLKWCDENRPRCINCVTAQLRCPYEAESRPASRNNSYSPISNIQSSETPQSTRSSTSKSPGTAFQLQSSNLSIAKADTDAGAPLNMLHLELLYAWSSNLYKILLLSPDGPRTYADTCMQHGLRYPFLMRQMLATSALNISIFQPEKREVYHQHAVQLQAEALNGFHAALKDLNKDNIVAAFLVSSLIGLHVFCETFSFRDEQFNKTFDAFIGCINLLRGIRSLIGDWWPYLLSTELKSILSVAAQSRAKGKENAYNLEDLRALVKDADIGTTSKDTYLEAIEELEHVYAAPAIVEDPENAQFANMLFAWLVVVPKEYVDLLSQRRPEALIILTYYAVVLHQRRQFWAVSDAGSFLINGLSAHLGSHWDRWLAWPKSKIQG